MINPSRRFIAMQRTRVSARLLRKADSPKRDQIGSTNMNHSITFTGDWALHGIMSDLGVDFALSPFHRIGFKVDDAGIQALSERYPDRIFRARQWFRDEKLNWSTLLLRFDENAFL